MTEEALAVAAVFGLLALLALWARRSTPGGRRLEVVETVPVGQGRSIAVVRAGSKRLLVGVTAHTITPLSDLDAEEWSELSQASLPRLQTAESETP